MKTTCELDLGYTLVLIEKDLLFAYHLREQYRTARCLLR